MIPQRQILPSPSWLWFETATSGSFRHPALLHSFCYPVVGARGRDCVESDAIKMIVVSMELQWRFLTVTGVLLCTQGDTSTTCAVYHGAKTVAKGDLMDCSESRFVGFIKRFSLFAVLHSRISS